MKLSFCLVCFVGLLVCHRNQCEAYTCNIGIAPLARAACLASCQLQNCGTGTCNSKKVCVCGRCANGPNIQLSLGKGK